MFSADIATLPAKEKTNRWKHNKSDSTCCSGLFPPFFSYSQKYHFHNERKHKNEECQKNHKKLILMYCRSVLTVWVNDNLIRNAIRMSHKQTQINIYLLCLHKNR